jgi:hypothetical protein
MIYQTSLRSGRLEKRTPLAVPLQVSSLQDSTAIERTTTENVSSLGIRAVMRRPRELDERLIVKSPGGVLQTLARVVYCQRLSDGRFGVGFQFLQKATNWLKKSLAGAG